MELKEFMGLGFRVQGLVTALWLSGMAKPQLTSLKES